MFSIEETLIDWLAKKTSIEAFGSPPSDRPKEFMTVERTGGPTTIGKDEPAIAVQCWAASRRDAQRMALTVKALCLEVLWQEVPEVCQCKINGIYNFPDPESRSPRYQIGLDFVTRN